MARPIQGAARVYLVRREIGGQEQFVQSESPHVGEPIYHGKFRSRIVTINKTICAIYEPIDNEHAWSQPFEDTKGVVIF